MAKPVGRTHVTLLDRGSGGLKRVRKGCILRVVYRNMKTTQSKFTIHGHH